MRGWAIFESHSAHAGMLEVGGLGGNYRRRKNNNVLRYKETYIGLGLLMHTSELSLAHSCSLPSSSFISAVQTFCFKENIFNTSNMAARFLNR